MPANNRPSARVIVIDYGGRVLLFCVADPQSVKAPSWVVPGGGLEAGQTAAEAAARELLEETGTRIEPSELGKPVAVNRGECEFHGKKYFSESENLYFWLRTETFEPNDANWTAGELEWQVGWRWWTLDELECTADVVYRPQLAAMCRDLASGRRPHVPIELPWV